MTTKYYRVGDHDFGISFVDPGNNEELIPSFRKFAIEAPSGPLLFTLTVDDSFRWKEAGREIGVRSGGFQLQQFQTFRTPDHFRRDITDDYVCLGNLFFCYLSAGNKQDVAALCCLADS